MVETFADRYAAAALNLLGSLPDTAGMDERSLSQAERHFGLSLPEALKDYYLALGNLRELNKAHNRLLSPKDCFIDGGKLAFMVENQAVVYWGVGAGKSPEDDPSVLTTNWRRVGGFNEMVAYCRRGKAACLLADSGQLYVGGRTESSYQQIAAELRAVGVRFHQL